MNLRKLKNQAGFTLVELIVVIAIMAILAGVAVPVYSGYIEKAEKAGDLQLLGAVNSAFSAACFENGATDMSKVDASITLGGSEGSKTIQSVSASADGLDGANVPASFTKYFAGNESSAFKVIEELKFENGVFKDKNDVVNTKYPQGAGMTDGEIDAAVGKHNNSNNVGKEQELAGSVENLSGLLADELDGGLNLEAYMSEDDYAAFKEKYGITDDSSSEEIANATVMYVAGEMNGVTAQDIYNLTGGNLSNIEAISKEYGTIPTAALMYGVVTGYANSGNASADFLAAYETPPTGISDVSALVSKMASDPNFNTYYTNTEKGIMADMDGYLAAMEVVSNYEGTLDLSNPSLFTDEDTLALLESVLGTSN